MAATSTDINHDITEDHKDENYIHPLSTACPVRGTMKIDYQ